MKLSFNLKQRRRFHLAFKRVNPMNRLAVTLLPTTMFGLLAISFVSDKHELFNRLSSSLFILLSFVLVAFVCVEIYAMSKPHKLIPQLFRELASFFTVFLTIFAIMNFSGVLTGFLTWLVSPHQEEYEAFMKINNDLQKKQDAYWACFRERDRRFFEVRLAIASAPRPTKELVDEFKTLKKMCEDEKKEADEVYEWFKAKAEELDPEPNKSSAFTNTLDKTPI